MLINNSSFEFGAAGWRPVNLAAAVKQEIISDGTARSGANFLRVSTTQEFGSVAFDFGPNLVSGGSDINGVSVEVAAQFPSVGVLTWVRSAPGQGPFAGTLTLWQLSGSNNTIHPNANFTVGTDWTLITNCVDFNAQGVNTRIEFYLETVNAFLDIDSVLAF